MSSATTEVYDVKARAKEWVDGVNAATGLATGWRLQILRLRTKRKFGKDTSALPEPDSTQVDSNGGNPVSVEHTPETGECPDLPILVRRFVPGCPWELVDEAVRYLHRIAPYRDVIYNGIPVQGVYRPISTTWQRDEQTLSPGERKSLGTYTLVQDLIEITACPDELESLTSSSCQSDEETTFVWDADSVDAPPATCEQGVTWEVRAVSRDENGQFSYQLVKRTAKTRAWGPRTIECGEMSSTEEWGWRNAYGDPSTGVIEVRACGSETPVAVQLPGCDEPGVTTQVNTELNPDCTWDVVVRRRTSKPVSESWTEGTFCRPQTTVSYENSVGLPDIPAPAPGERVSAQFRINPDRTLSGAVSVQAAPEALDWHWTDGPGCRPVQHDEWRNQIEQPVLPSVGPGETLSAEYSRTEDCLWNASFRTVAPRPEFSMDWTEGSQCRPEYRSLRQGALVPPDPAEFAPPSDGGTIRGSVSMNEDCTYDWAKEVRAPVVPWMDSWVDGTLCRKREVTVWQSSPSRPQVPEPEQGESVSASFSRSDDCTFSGEVRIMRPAEPSAVEWTDGTTCMTVTHTAYESQTSLPQVPSPVTGTTVDASFRRDEDCTFSGAVAVRRMQPGSVSWTQGSSCDREEVQLQWAQPSVVVPTPASGSVVAARVSRNQDCTFDVQSEVSTREPWLSTESWTDGTNRVTRTSYSGQPAPITQDSTAYGRASNEYRRDADCTFSGTSTVIEPLEGSGGSSDYLWGPSFGDPTVEYIGPCGDPDPLASTYQLAIRVSYPATGSRHLKDLSDDIVSASRQGYTLASYSALGSYSRGDESPSVVFNAIFSKTVIAVVERASTGSGIEEAVEAAIKKATDGVAPPVL